MTAVSVQDVWKSYDGRPVLERLNIEVEEGAFCAIVGASGCGKSTFLRLLLAQELPSRGEIRIADAEPATEPQADRGIVFQRYSVFPHLTVRDNLIFAAEIAASRTLGRTWGRTRRRLRNEAEATLERVGLSHAAKLCPSALSGGMQQRLAIAQALTKKPKVLLLDEPFGALDPGTRATMHEFLLELWRETAMTIFMVTHDIKEAFKLATRILAFDKVRDDPTDPGAYGATITYDLPLDDKTEKDAFNGPN